MSGNDKQSNANTQSLAPYELWVPRFGGGGRYVSFHTREDVIRKAVDICYGQDVSYADWDKYLGDPDMGGSCLIGRGNEHITATEDYWLSNPNEALRKLKEEEIDGNPVLKINYDCAEPEDEAINELKRTLDEQVFNATYDLYDQLGKPFDILRSVVQILGEPPVRVEYFIPWHDYGRPSGFGYGHRRWKADSQGRYSTGSDVALVEELYSGAKSIEDFLKAKDESLGSEKALTPEEYKKRLKAIFDWMFKTSSWGGGGGPYGNLYLSLGDYHEEYGTVSIMAAINSTLFGETAPGLKEPEPEVWARRRMDPGSTYLPIEESINQIYDVYFPQLRTKYQELLNRSWIVLWNQIASGQSLLEGWNKCSATTERISLASENYYKQIKNRLWRELEGEYKRWQLPEENFILLLLLQAALQSFEYNLYEGFSDNELFHEELFEGAQERLEWFDLSPRQWVHSVDFRKFGEWVIILQQLRSKRRQDIERQLSDQGYATQGYFTSPVRGDYPEWKEVESIESVPDWFKGFVPEEYGTSEAGGEGMAVNFSDDYLKVYLHEPTEQEIGEALIAYCRGESGRKDLMSVSVLQNTKAG